jgi:putative Holliday junction resolvase
MARFLAIDYGKRRIGLARGESALPIAVPRPPLLVKANGSPWEALGRTIREERIDALVVGLPLAMDGTKTRWTEEVEAFAAQLHTRFSLPVHLSDERLTSYQVDEDLLALGMRPKLSRAIGHRRTGRDDSRAAALLLQDFFNEHFPRNQSGGMGGESMPC